MFKYFRELVLAAGGGAPVPAAVAVWARHVAAAASCAGVVGEPAAAPGQPAAGREPTSRGQIRGDAERG